MGVGASLAAVEQEKKRAKENENIYLRLMFEERAEKRELTERLQATLQPAALEVFRDEAQKEVPQGGLGSLFPV